MSVLDNTNSAPRVPAPVIVADQIRYRARSTFKAITDAFNDGARLFWNNPKATPEEIAEALGGDAKEIFELHAKLGALVSDVKPSAITTGLSVVGKFSINEDGTVTVIKE